MRVGRLLTMSIGRLSRVTRLLVGRWLGKDRLLLGWLIFGRLLLLLCFAILNKNV